MAATHPGHVEIKNNHLQTVEEQNAFRKASQMDVDSNTSGIVVAMDGGKCQCRL